MFPPGGFCGAYPGRRSLCATAQGLASWVEAAASRCNGLNWNGGVALGQDHAISVEQVYKEGENM